ncbi:sensor histidine kinase [Sinomicrobium soli]|uniref:sensor histidine kinase n=1 Tax=Sinomicrobium sp. N-1-3-6 TaxID=2219864 RepID=UPI000DCC36CF|nr:HAMP domain-containing sensor histidine kinase [Sinomicrobium sp. N-1-3-6]RAV30631.1 ATP-binding protein [Sinomicrobium sp. N-1-3-6]
MIYSAYKKAFLWRVGMLMAGFTGAVLGVVISNSYLCIAGLLFAGMGCYYLYVFCNRRFEAVDGFFEAVRYRDFSRWYPESGAPGGIKELYRGFNEVNRTIVEIKGDKELQHQYLRKILEMAGVGIMAYNLETGKVLWDNESIRRFIDIPSVRNVSFIADRKPGVFAAVFENEHAGETDVTVEVNGQKSKMLVSNTVFRVGADSFRLVVLQNIDDTLNRNESDAWKKLLSVMTHEIMNSIAPISSLAETLKSNIQEAMEHPETHPLEMEDLHLGIDSIKTRSEGLMKFAKTYRSLNKITQLNKNRISAEELFRNIHKLMYPSLSAKNIVVDYRITPHDLEVQIDTYLIEQVLINLILNAVDACSGIENPHIVIAADRPGNEHTRIRVSDNGRGIPESVMEHVFVPFFSTKKKGSGIGLSLCKQIVLLHQGRIQLQSTEGQGTVVSLVL